MDNPEMEQHGLFVVGSEVLGVPFEVCCGSKVERSLQGRLMFDLV
jgi:hypothetical protein